MEQAADTILVLNTLAGNRFVKGCHWHKVRDGAEDRPAFAFKLANHAAEGQGAWGVALEPVGMSNAVKAREIRRLHPGWSGKEIAEHLGVNASTVSRALREME